MREYGEASGLFPLCSSTRASLTVLEVLLRFFQYKMPAQALSLRVLSDETPDGSWELLPNSSQRYKTARAIIDLLFQLLERSDMREWLIVTARHIVTGLRQTSFEGLWPRGRRRDSSLPEMPSFIDFFLQELRRDFLEIRLTRNLQGEAAVYRKEWASEQNSPTVYSWRGKDLGYMLLARDVSLCTLLYLKIFSHTLYMNKYSEFYIVHN